MGLDASEPAHSTKVSKEGEVSPAQGVAICHRCCTFNKIPFNKSQLHLALTFLAAALCCSFQAVDTVCLLNELIFFSP